MPNELLPGILEQDWTAIEKKFEIIRPFAKTVHIDIIDGVFAPSTTFLDPEPFKKYSQDFFLELHMMVKDPLTYVEPFARAGFRRFVAHIEQMPDQVEFVAKTEQLGEVGLALDGPTPLSAITVSLEDLDSLLIFTAGQVGSSGQPFEEARVGRVAEAHTREPLLPVTVDGGIKLETIPHALKAGASRFVATSTIFTSENPAASYKALLDAITTSETESATEM